MGDTVFIFGELDSWPSKEEMADLLRAAGVSLSVGADSIRLDDCENFAFQQYGGDVVMPTVEADGSSLESMLRDGNHVSAPLSQAGIRHRFEIYNSDGDMIGYIHNQWPLPAEPPTAREFKWLHPWWPTASQGRGFRATFERELKYEVGKGHQLYRVKARLIARGNGDDALFELRDRSGRYAVVHLTWARHPEPLPWPATEIYDSLDSFSTDRMIPENSQFETET